MEANLCLLEQRELIAGLLACHSDIAPLPRLGGSAKRRQPWESQGDCLMKGIFQRLSSAAITELWNSKGCRGQRGQWIWPSPQPGNFRPMGFCPRSTSSSWFHGQTAQTVRKGLVWFQPSFGNCLPVNLIHSFTSSAVRRQGRKVLAFCKEASF